MSTNREAGTATVEAVLVTPVILLLLAVLMAGGKVTSDQAAIRAVVREAGRVAVTASTPQEAISLGRARAGEVAASYGLDARVLGVSVDPGSFMRGTDVVVNATYAADLTAVPSLGLLPGSVRLEAGHAEPIDRYISR